MSETRLFAEALRAGEGILRMAPCWVPRSFLVPGGRLKLHPDDLYALGAHRGGIDERWFSSTTPADNGPGTPKDEGLSYFDYSGKRALFKDAVADNGDQLLGADVMRREGGFNLLCKFFDNRGPIPHHMHQMDEHAKRVGRKGKPESYYFPPQYNFTGNNFPHTYMGLEPGTTKDDVRRCLQRWDQGDNGILYHSKAYRLQPGTGWHVAAGVLHAPGSLVTYEPQVNSDVFGMFQSLVEDRPVPWSLLVKDVPPELAHDLDYIISMLDWEKNVDPEFGEQNKRFPAPVRDEAEMKEAGYRRGVDFLWHCAVLRQGTDGLAWPLCRDPGRGGLRLDTDPGTRSHRHLGRRNAQHDPVWGDDGRRSLRQRTGSARGGPDHQQQPAGKLGDAETLRAGQSRRSTPHQRVTP